MHVVGGSKKIFHDVPGRSPQARNEFKQSVVTAGVQASVQAAGEHPKARASARGKPPIHVVFCGDLNLAKKDVKDAVEWSHVAELGAVESFAVHHVTAQGEPLPPVRGVQHQRSAEYMARQQAKMLTKDAKKRPGEEWSEKKGDPYFDRHGERQYPEKDGEFMVTLVLRAYAARRGLDYDSRPGC